MKEDISEEIRVLSDKVKEREREIEECQRRLNKLLWLNSADQEVIAVRQKQLTKFKQENV